MDIPSPRDQRFVIEWDALKIAMQHPLLVGVAFDELDDHDFTHPWLAAVRAGDGEGRWSGGRSSR